MTTTPIFSDAYIATKVLTGNKLGLTKGEAALLMSRVLPLMPAAPYEKLVEAAIQLYLGKLPEPAKLPSGWKFERSGNVVTIQRHGVEVARIHYVGPHWLLTIGRKPVAKCSIFRGIRWYVRNNP